MNHLAPLTMIAILMAFAVGCGWSRADKGAPDAETIAPPEVTKPDATGRVSYAPTLPPLRDLEDPERDAGWVLTPSDMSAASPDMGSDVETPKTEQCVYEEVIHKVDPEEIESVKLQGVYSTIEFTDKFSLPRAFRNADHIHLKHAILYAEGGDLSFLSWVTLDLAQDGLPDRRVAWGSDIDQAGITTALKVDGSIDLAPYAVDRITLKGVVRAKSPRKDTTLAGNLVFDTYKHCVWR